MVYRMEPEKLVCEFLHSDITDPRGRLTSATQNETGDGSTTIYALDSTDTKAITSLTLDAVSQIKHNAYGINLDSSTPYIEFSSAPSNGAAIVINYKAGTGWIFPDKPRLDLTKTSYPRISILKIAETGDSVGISDTDDWRTVTLQVDVYNKKGVGFSNITELSSQATFDNDLTNFITRKVDNVLKENWRNNNGTRGADMHRIRKTNDFIHPYDDINDLFHHTIELEFQGEDIGGEY